MRQARISTRSRLFGHLRAFVENELRGIISWNDVHSMPGIPAERIEHNRRNPLGEFKEVAGIVWGDAEYELVVSGPEVEHADGKHYPCGLVELKSGGVIDSGPIDQATWARLGDIIRQRQTIKAEDHGRRERSESKWA